MEALFDRCNSIIHCVGLEGKYGVVVETSGGGEHSKLLGYMEAAVNTVGAQSVGGIASVMAGFRTFPQEDALFVTAQELGMCLCRSMEQKSHFPEQDAYLSAFRYRMMKLVEYRQKEWIYEYEFWKARI